ncbi:MAG: TasA family protein [Eggerthellaceae bacterium]|nr:TasA family protein [Eggerthellaceae bacterium]
MPFSVSGMLPGDAASQNIELDVSHKAAVTVQFEVERVEDRAGDTANLSEVLQLRVVDRSTGAVVVQGTAADLLGRAVSVEVDGEGVSRLSWAVEASLPASMGNEYQNVACVVDLHWFVGAEDASSLAPIPQTGDPLLWLLAMLVVACAVAVACFAATRSRRVGAHEAATGAAAGVASGAAARGLAGASSGASAPGSTESADEPRLPLGVKGRIAVAAVSALLLVAAAAGIAWAMFWAHERLPENQFATGSVSVSLVGGFDEVNIEPGKTVIEDFAVSNTGSVDSYWRMYLQDLQGDLADALEVTVLDEQGTVLYQGDALSLDRGTAFAQGAEALFPGESETFTVQVHMCEGAGNGYQGTCVTFDVGVDAVQARNNEGREF